MSLAAFKSLQWADFFLYSFTDPGALYRQIKRNDPRPFAMSFVIPVIVIFTEVIAGSLIGTETHFFYSKISYGWLLFALWAVFKIIIAAALMDCFAQMLGYGGNIREIITLVNFSLLPKLLLLPAIYIFRVLHFAAPFFYIFISFLLFLWSAFIAISGIAEMHDSGFSYALLIFIFPYLLVAVTLIFMIILGVLYAVRLVF